eukprot:7263425-Heterocapsa_arctica.AAC.1
MAEHLRTAALCTAALCTAASCTAALLAFGLQFRFCVLCRGPALRAGHGTFSEHPSWGLNKAVF